MGKINFKCRVQRNLSISFFTDNCTVYNGKNNGLGITANWRNNSSATKPFIKIYNKSIEIQDKHNDFFSLLHGSIQNELMYNNILRYEYTIKDKDYCKKFGITNKLKDLFDLSQDKLREIGQYMYQANFGIVLKKHKPSGKLSPSDKKMCILIYALHQSGTDMIAIRDMLMDDTGTKQTKYKDKKYWEKLYYYVTVGHEREVRNDFERIKEWNTMLGFNIN